MGRAKSTDAERQAILREQIVLNLQSLGEPLTTVELIHELTVLRHAGAVDLPPINETSVYAALEDLVIECKVDEAPAGVWHPVYKLQPQQKGLFE